jgi:hypothetical protein
VAVTRTPRQGVSTVARSKRRSGSRASGAGGGCGARQGRPREVGDPRPGGERGVCLLGRLDHVRAADRRDARAARSDTAGVEAGVSPVMGVRWFREAGGMAPIGQAPLSGRYLWFAEREESAIVRAQGGCGRSRGGWVARRRRSRASCGARPRRAARAWSIARQRRSGMPISTPSARKPAKLAVNQRSRGYVEERLAGRVQRPDGVVLAGPQVAWIGRRRGRRRDRRWAKSWSQDFLRASSRSITSSF